MSKFVIVYATDDYEAHTNCDIHCRLYVGEETDTLLPQAGEFTLYGGRKAFEALCAASPGIQFIPGPFIPPTRRGRSRKEARVQ